MRHAIALTAVLMGMGLHSISAAPLQQSVQSARPDVDAVVPEVEEAAALLQVPMGAHVSKETLVATKEAMRAYEPNLDALHNIQALKAYTISAQDVAQDALMLHSSTQFSALTLLITEFGDTADEELVTEFAQKMASLHVKFSEKGFPDYLLEHLQEAVLGGKGVIKVEKGRAKYDSSVLGFQDEPDYIRDLGVYATAFQSQLTDVESKTSHADSMAAMQCLQAGMLEKYTSFLGKIQAKYHAEAQDYWKKVVLGASTAVHDKYNETGDIHDQPEAGLGGAGAAIAAISGGEEFEMPSPWAMEREAEALAGNWSATQTDKCGSVVNDVEGVEAEQEDMPACTMMSGTYGAGSIVLTVDRSDLHGSVSTPEGGSDLSGTITNITETTCSGTAAGPMTTYDINDAETVSTFVYDDTTEMITWSNGPSWSKYVAPDTNATALSEAEDANITATFAKLDADPGVEAMDSDDSMD